MQHWRQRPRELVPTIGSCEGVMMYGCLAIRCRRDFEKLNDKKQLQVSIYSGCIGDHLLAGKEPIKKDGTIWLRCGRSEWVGATRLPTFAALYDA